MPNGINGRGTPVARPRSSEGSGALALLVALHVLLAALAALNNWPLVARLMQSPPAYVPGHGFFSPVVELVVVGHLLAAAGLLRSARWAWGLSLPLQVFHALTDGSVVRGGSLEVLLARSAFPWFLPYAANLLMLILLLLPSVVARCRMDGLMSALDPILLKMIGLEQVVLGCIELLLPWGYLILFLPVALFLAALNFVGVPLAFTRHPAARGMVLTSQAITAFVLGAWHRVNGGPGPAPWLIAAEVFATSASAFLAAPALDRVLSFRRVATASPEPPPSLAEDGRRRSPFALPVGGVAALVLAIAVALAGWSLTRGARAGATRVARFDLNAAAGDRPLFELDAGVAISPDGLSVAALAISQGHAQAWVRTLADDRAFGFGAPGGLRALTFSPDSQALAFVTGTGDLVTTPLPDGQRTLVARGADPRGGLAWGPKGIVFCRTGTLWAVAADGGRARAITLLEPALHEVLHTDPIVLPAGRTVLFVSRSADPEMERIEAVSIDGGGRSVVVPQATTPIWSPTGHLLFEQGGGVWAAPFDVGKLALGEPREILPAGVVRRTPSGALAMRLSASGTLLYLPVAAESAARVLCVARDGSALPCVEKRRRYSSLRLAPDGKRLVAEIGGDHLETLDFGGNPNTLTAPVAQGTSEPVWNTDGSRIVFRRPHALFATDAMGLPRPLPGETAHDRPSGAGPDPESVLVTRTSPETGEDVYRVSLNGTIPAAALVATKAAESAGQLSPDGRWLLYVTNGADREGIDVRPYPQLDRVFTIARGPALQPRWDRASREVYYRDGAHLMAVPFDGSGREPIIGAPVALFADDYDFGRGIGSPCYDVTADGRFIMLASDSSNRALRIALNWTQELTARSAGHAP